MHKLWTLPGRGTRCVLIATLVGSAPLATGCYAYRATAFAPQHDVTLPEESRSARGPLRDNLAVVNVFFATTRQPTQSDEPELHFGIERAEQLTYGCCEVTVPIPHKRGRIYETLGGDNPRKDICLRKIEVFTRPEFCARIQAQLERFPTAGVLVFTHGYAESFAHAARRTAQLAHDTEFDGVPVLFSWPSRGILLGYLMDSLSVEWSIPPYAE
jgi:esterase/lipase superfamily enzyme